MYLSECYSFIHVDINYENNTWKTNKDLWSYQTHSEPHWTFIGIKKKKQKQKKKKKQPRLNIFVCLSFGSLYHWNFCLFVCLLVHCTIGIFYPRVKPSPPEDEVPKWRPIILSKDRRATIWIELEVVYFLRTKTCRRFCIYYLIFSLNLPKRTASKIF
jgi:hypothetical protein